MKKYSVAVIGLGRMGSFLDMSIANAAKESDRLELVAGADLLEERRTKFEGDWGVPVYEDYREMVERHSPDIAAICTTATGLQKPGREAPSTDFMGDSHADDAIEVVEAGVPMLFVEKAMSCSIAKADAVLEACQSRGVKYGSGLLRRHNNAYKAVRKAVDDGEIGELQTAVHYGGSSLMHGHIHSIDTLSYLVGDRKIGAVRGELIPRDTCIEGNRIESDPRAVYQLEFEDGLMASTVPGGGFEFEVIGSEGTIRTMNNGSTVAMRKASSGEGRPQMLDAAFPATEPMNNTLACLEDLVDAHEQGREAHGGIAVTHHVTEACIAVAESHRRGGVWVDLPVDNRDMYIFHV